MSENPPKSRSFGVAEIAGTALIVPAVLVLLGLLSYQDTTATGDISNLIGTGGHVTAELLFYLFGFAAFVIPPYAIAVGGFCLMRGEVPDLLLRAIALFILVIASAVLIYLTAGVDETAFWSGGGVMGRRLGDGLETIVGVYGAYILAIGAVLPGLMLGSPYSLPEIVRGLSKPVYNGAGQGLRSSTSGLWKLGAIAIGVAIAGAAHRAARKQSTSPEPVPEENDSTPSSDESGDSGPAHPAPRTAADQDTQKEHERMKASKQVQRARRTAEEAPAPVDPAASLPFFKRVAASRKPWFERVEDEVVGQADPAETRRGELGRLSPTYGRQVELDNAFLLSSRARHVRSLLQGLSREDEPAAGPTDQPTPAEGADERDQDDQSASFGRGLQPPRHAGGKRRSRTGVGSAAGGPSLKTSASRRAATGVDEYGGYFSEDDSRFHFRSLDLDGRGQARASVARRISAEDHGPLATATRPAQVRAARMRSEGDALLRPINLKILEREQDVQERREAQLDREQAADFARPGHAPSDQTHSDQAMSAGNLALAREESQPYQTRVIENFDTGAMETVDLDRDGGLNLQERSNLASAPDASFLKTESAVMAALAERTVPATEMEESGAVDAPQAHVEEQFVNEDGPSAGAELSGEVPVEEESTAEHDSSEPTSGEPLPGDMPSSEPMQHQRPLRPAQKEAPPFPDLPAVEVIRPDYYIPRDILRMPGRLPPEDIKGEIALTKQRLEKTLADFGIKAEIVRTQRGPIITLYEIRPDAGIKVSRIMGIVDEIKMNLEARSVRIIAPIPGKNTVGIEIPNKRREEVTLGELVRHDPQFFGKQRELSLAMGKDISGENGYVDLTRLPHLLIAGATGAGKSVYMNTIIASLLYTRSPQELRFIMIDPKMVELTLFEGIPHLLMPVITDVRRASKALNWAVHEMERRYAFLSHMKCRDIRSYNSKFARGNSRGSVSSDDAHMPYLVIFIDELSDLMIMAPKDVEDSIIRLTQKARAVGIHIVMATQRPSVDVITALIKANCPARIAFQVAQKTDSRVILDSNGAETLLGRGDMLYKTPAATGLGRIQTPLIEESEIERIVQETRRYGRPSYIELPGGADSDEEGGSDSEDVDRSLFEEAWKIVQDTGKTSTSYIQRRLRIGYNRAARIIEMMEEKGYLGPQVGNRPREILKKD